MYCRSYDAVCFRLHCLLDSLWELVSENSVSRTEALIQLSFTAIQTVNSVRSLLLLLFFSIFQYVIALQVVPINIPYICRSSAP